MQEGKREDQKMEDCQSFPAGAIYSKVCQSSEREESQTLLPIYEF